MKQTLADIRCHGACNDPTHKLTVLLPEQPNKPSLAALPQAAGAFHQQHQLVSATNCLRRPADAAVAWCQGAGTPVNTPLVSSSCTIPIQEAHSSYSCCSAPQQHHTRNWMQPAFVHGTSNTTTTLLFDRCATSPPDWPAKVPSRLHLQRHHQEHPWQDSGAGGALGEVYCGSQRAV
jgi:hypothetical protein